MEVNLNEVLCRACLLEDEFMVDIYEEVEEFQMSLSELLERCGEITVDKQDSFPKYLCQECTNELLIAAKFRRKCSETQKALKAQEIQAKSVVYPAEHFDSPPPFSIEQEVEIVLDMNESVEYENKVTHEELPVVVSEDGGHSPPHVFFNCDVCGAVFKQTSRLEVHIDNLHAPTSKFKCQLCGHCYTQQSNLKTHSCAGRGILIDSPRRHCCTFCNKLFPSPSSLRMHLRLHNGERPFACSVCSKTFKTNSALVGHQKRHLQLTAHQCPHCEKSFVESSNLRRHIVALHTTDRPHTCTICERSFSRVYLLELHMRTHTGERPYACSQCDRSFVQQGVLRNHERTHTGFRLHQCAQCDKSFSRAGQLKHHQQNTHCNGV